jgi:hypothetical protein
MFLVAAAATAVAGLIVVGAFVTGDRPQAVLSLLIATLGMSLGWFAGILASPRGVKDEARFQKISHLAWVFVSGYLISKLDGAFKLLFSPEQLANVLTMTRLISFALAFVVTAITVYAVRSSAAPGAVA